MSSSESGQITAHEVDNPITSQLIAEAKDYFAQNELRILLVEDDEINQKIIELFLTDMGCSVDIVANGNQAIEVDLAQYSAIVLDIGLPGLNGLDVARILRASEKPYANIPILALTAHMQAYHRPQCLAAGINEFLLKPATTDELQCMLYKAIMVA